jgi:hypothetical protein
MMKTFLLALLLLGTTANARTAYDSWRMPSAGNLPSWGKVDLANGTTGNAPLATALAGGLGGQVCYQSAAGVTAFLANGTAGQILQSNGTTLAPSWVAAGGGGTVTAVSVTSANGFAGSSSGGATPALTLSTTITGLLKGDGTAISAATSGTDYSLGTSALATGIIKSTTTTGALTIAVAGDFPTLNQDTTGKSAKTDALNSATTTINVSSATAPTSGQVLTATSSTAATWQTPAGGGSGLLNAKFGLNGAIVPFTNIDGPHYQTGTQSLTAVYISAFDSGTSGSIQIRVNQYRSGSLLNSATGSLSASSGNPSGTSASLSGTLSLQAADILTVDVVSVSGGTPTDLSVEY